ncbi:MAG: DUF1631 family protein [Comamonadaceae bacterium]
MVTLASPAQRTQLAQEARKRFVGEVGRAMVELGAAVQDRLTALMNEVATSREMQIRRDAWTAYQRHRTVWVEGTLKAWQTALTPAAVKPKEVHDGAFELVGNEIVENKIVASRLVLSVMEKVISEWDDLRVRIKFLEGTQDLDGQDILRPDVMLLLMIERWTSDASMPREVWPMVNEVAQKLLTERVKQAYASCNAFLIQKGVLPTIEFKDRVKRTPSVAPRAGASNTRHSGQTPLEAPYWRDSQRSGYDGDGGHAGSYASTGSGAQRPSSQTGQFGPRTGAMPGPSGPAPMHGYQASGPQSSGYGSAADETRLMTSMSPLARARGRALGVMGQLKRLLVGSAGVEFEATHYLPPSPALAAAIAVHARSGRYDAGDGTVIQDYSPARVAQVAADLRRTTTDLKNKAQTKSEKATIEIVALMFQAILQEERIPPGIRVWFARLQMPVLREALAEPDFFGTVNHPARLLIDRMGSCVMGFDASAINGSALEIEIKRVVQVIEQYPETGKRVYQLVYEEFQKFLAQFLTGKAATKKLVSVAQQVEEKETLAIQYTIEMRDMLKDMPVRDEIRQFLFKIWAEVLALTAVRKGRQHAETLDVKKSATDLVWAASAKPNRADRARVIKDLPQLLQKLRFGMTQLGVAPSAQEIHIKVVRDTLADAFLSKTQTISTEQIAAMAQRLAQLEDFVSEDGMGDLPLDAQSMELMLGIDSSNIEVVADGGSKPNAAMLAWAKELQLGTWFTLDHNGQVVQVQFVWRSERNHLNLFASTAGRSYLVQAGRLAAYLQAGLMLPQEEETLTVRATRHALLKLDANPERLLG